MAVLAAILAAIALRQGDGRGVEGLKVSATMGLEILPLLVFAFLVAGYVQVLLPKEAVSRWLGAEAGARGILLGALAGTLAPGGPYINFPVVAALLRAGAGVGTAVAFLTAWSLTAITRLPLEIGIIGWRFALARFAVSFFFPPIAGWLAHVLFGGSRWT